MMEFINKYKYEKKIIYATVNEMATDALDFGAFHHHSLSEEDLKDFYSVARSDYLQDIYNERHLKEHVILPQQRELSNNGTTMKYTYVSFRQICEKYIKNKYILQKIILEQSTQIHQSDAYESILDGELSEERNFRGKLKFELYVDDVELMPGNGKGKSRKYLQVYTSCVDVPFHRRMHQNQIELLMMIDRKKVTTLNIDDPLPALFSPLKQDLVELMNDGLQVEFKGQRFTVQVVITSILGDNLGIYELLGRSCSFNSNSFVCRYCHAYGNSKRDAVENTQNISIGMNLVTGQEDGSFLSLGQHTVRTFPFAGLSDINQWNIAAPDIMHDVNEGTMTHVLELILTSLVEKSKAKFDSYNWGNTKREVVNFINGAYTSGFVPFYEGSVDISWSEGSFKLLGNAALVSKKLRSTLSTPV